MFNINEVTVKWCVAMIGSKEYAVIEHEDKEHIEACGLECFKVENSNDTYNFMMEKLPQLREGLYRLWFTNTWTNNGNRRTEALKTCELREQAHRIKHQYLVEDFMAKGIPEAMVRSMMSRFDWDLVEKTYDIIVASKQAGTTDKQ